MNCPAIALVPLLSAESVVHLTHTQTQQLNQLYSLAVYLYSMSVGCSQPHPAFEKFHRFRDLSQVRTAKCQVPCLSQHELQRAGVFNHLDASDLRLWSSTCNAEI